MLGCHCEERSDEAIRNILKNGLPQPFSRLRNDRRVIIILFTPTFETEPKKGAPLKKCSLKNI